MRTLTRGHPRIYGGTRGGLQADSKQFMGQASFSVSIRAEFFGPSRIASRMTQFAGVIQDLLEMLLYTQPWNKLFSNALLQGLSSTIGSLPVVAV